MDRYVAALPSPALRPWVRSFAEAHMSGFATYRELPTDEVHLILAFGTPTHMPETGERLVAFVPGWHDARALVEVRDWHGVEVALSPLGARRLLGLPMAELRNRCVPLDALLPRGDELLERLAGLPGPAERFAALEELIARRLADAPAPRPDVLHAWTRLKATHGRVPIAQLQRELGCSRRHLSARFKEEIGAGPKAAARVLRFQHALRLAVAGASLADAAAQAGFSDQAHLSRDVRDLSGLTPSALVAERTPVTLLQDEALAAA